MARRRFGQYSQKQFIRFRQRLDNAINSAQAKNKQEQSPQQQSRLIQTYDCRVSNNCIEKTILISDFSNMKIQTYSESSPLLPNQIINNLKEVPLGLSSRRINTLISEFNIAEIASCLRHLQADGYVRLISGTKWQWTGKTYTHPQSIQTSSVDSSSEAEPKYGIPKKEVKVNIPKNTRWDEFRRLCLYYAECIRLEDKAKVHAYSEHEGRSFISPSGYLNIRNLALGGTLRIEIKENWEQFLQTLHRRKSNPRFYIGYPTYVHIFKDSATGKNLQIITPIFVQQVECSVVHDALEIRATGSVEVNNDWLERRFKSNEDRQAFLEQMGLYSPDHTEPKNFQEDFEELTKLLYIYYPKDFCEYPNAQKLCSSPEYCKIEKSGHYNRLILISQKKLKYSERLHSELHELAVVEDEKLDRSALKHLFHHEPISTLNKSVPPKEEADETKVPLPRLAEYESMDEKQLEACRYAMSEPITIITGPPGTGKSRVVSQIMANAVLNDQTVLFASKNHQAIEAVVPRLNELVQPDMLVISTARKFGSDDSMNLAKALIALLDTPRIPDLKQKLEDARASLSVTLEYLDNTEKQRLELFQSYQELDDQERLLAGYLKAYPEYYEQIISIPAVPPEEIVAKAIAKLSVYCKYPKSLFLRIGWKAKKLLFGRKHLSIAVKLERIFCDVFREQPRIPCPFGKPA